AVRLGLMNVLITGGAGYIGSVTAQTVLDKGHAVVVLDDLSTGHRAAVPGGASFVEADIADDRAVSAALAEHQVDAVMHFAAFSLVGDSQRRPLDYYENNVSGSVALLRSLTAAGVQ